MKTFMLLQQGDPVILEIYKEAHALWKEEFSQKWDISSLADKLGTLQLKFEHKMEKYGFDRWEGQEVFVVSGLTYFVDETNEGTQKSEKVREAFELSFCSMEVKGFSKRFSKALYLGGY
ncbi:hypothetical protein [Plesiomonas shigelloides]|uniref:hypothetical protein n=1 Tax=Plesiomonas shigelloides TaxID=703 RepID=UPI00126198E6|nr:hypothetical protein [Plesiomonas shigelloides]KAB7653424.1 hypothetical protein GBN14_14950 [Plesiomonas shigelloides]